MEPIEAHPDAPGDMAVYCPECDAAVIGQVHGYTFGQDGEHGPPERYTLLQCPGFHTMLVLQDEYHPMMKFDDDTPYRLYPAQDRHLSLEIPEKLRAAHNEARKCYGTKAYTATVLMCGRTIEAACKATGFTKGSLDDKLKLMKTQGVIDGRLSNWANLLRVVRNAAAHADDEEVGRQDAEDSLAFTEALLDYLWVLSARFDAMKARRQP